jgi:N-acetylglucosaminyl-diphospho-decaprenol L-rhamnosyltransferase
MARPAMAVVVVCHDSADDLAATLPALTAQFEPGDELVVVDNASRDGTPRVARELAPRATVIEMGANLGFAAGCNAGADASSAPLVLFLNPDAMPASGCIEALAACADRRPGWGAWQALVTMDGGRLVNTAGNEVHFLGFGWAGRCGAPVSAIDGAPADVGFASGAALVVRRVAWDAAGGFDARYFMYGEDLDLCLRLRLAGWGVGIEPRAVVEHGYVFDKGAYKWFYLERNRWWTIVGAYPAPLLGLLAPALLVFEVALLAAAWRGGWLAAKLRAQAAVIRLAPAMVRRRRAVQATRRADAGAFAAALTASLDSPYLAPAARVPGLAAAQGAYWRAVRAALRAAHH